MFDVKMEIEFWTGIMRDHALFQYNALSPKEVEAIKSTEYFMKSFDDLNREAKELQDNYKGKRIEKVLSDNMKVLKQFIRFKTDLLTKLLKCDIGLNLTPSFLNHMINEAMEYYKVLYIIKDNTSFDKTLENLRLNKIWLADASGHASAIACDLDAVEVEFTKKARKFQKKFDGLFKKAFEMYKMYERTKLNDGTVAYLNIEVEKTLTDSVEFLAKANDLTQCCSIMSALPPIIPDHMIREENYYLYRVKMLCNADNNKNKK